MKKQLILLCFKSFEITNVIQRQPGCTLYYSIFKWYLQGDELVNIILTQHNPHSSKILY